jgi:hypothetical protein
MRGDDAASSIHPSHRRCHGGGRRDGRARRGRARWRPPAGFRTRARRGRTSPARRRRAGRAKTARVATGPRERSGASFATKSSRCPLTWNAGQPWHLVSRSETRATRSVWRCCIQATENGGSPRRHIAAHDARDHLSRPLCARMRAIRQRSRHIHLVPMAEVGLVCDVEERL